MRIKNNSYKTFNNTKIEVSKDAQRTQFNEYLKILDNKIDDVVKNFEYYDIIKITQSVDNKAEFAYKYSKLLPFEAMIVNSEPFNYGGVQYTRGDLLLKLDKDDLHIKTQSAGYYYPSAISGERGSYQITYTYSNDNLRESATVTLGSSISEPAKTIAIQGLKFAQQQPIYGFSKVKDENVNSISFSINQMESHFEIAETPYKPIIKTYVVNKEGTANEEFVCDFEYKITTEKGDNGTVGTLTISSLPNIKLLVVVK